jgi:hypothetical protein
VKRTTKWIRTHERTHSAFHTHSWRTWWYRMVKVVAMEKILAIWNPNTQSSKRYTSLSSNIGSFSVPNRNSLPLQAQKRKKPISFLCPSCSFQCRSEMALQSGSRMWRIDPLVSGDSVKSERLWATARYTHSHCYAAYS